MEIDQEQFNISMRKFLKTVGVTSQQKIEEAVRKAITDNENLPNTLEVSVGLQIHDISLEHSISGTISLR
ncbi:MAG: DUF6494 family protein [Pseudomonadota bacterium]|nr:DUF6494 family protein [Pseudomonadota bacterium]